MQPWVRQVSLTGAPLKGVPRRSGAQVECSEGSWAASACSCAGSPVSTRQSTTTAATSISACSRPETASEPGATQTTAAHQSLPAEACKATGPGLKVLHNRPLLFLHCWATDGPADMQQHEDSTCHHQPAAHLVPDNLPVDSKPEPWPTPPAGGPRGMFIRLGCSWMAAAVLDEDGQQRDQSAGPLLHRHAGAEGTS